VCQFLHVLQFDISISLHEFDISFKPCSFCLDFLHTVSNVLERDMFAQVFFCEAAQGPRRPSVFPFLRPLKDRGGQVFE